MIRAEKANLNDVNHGVNFRSCIEEILPAECVAKDAAASSFMCFIKGMEMLTNSCKRDWDNIEMVD